MHNRSNRDQIKNPTFDSLLERAKSYSHLVKVNEQNNPAPNNNPAPANTSTEKKPDATNQAATAKPQPGVGNNTGDNLSQFVVSIADDMFKLLQTVFVILPAGDQKAIHGLDTMASDDMEKYSNAIKIELDRLENSLGHGIYSPAIEAANASWDFYTQALNAYEGYDKIKNNVPGLKDKITANIDIFNKSLESQKENKPVADSSTTDQDTKPEESKETAGEPNSSGKDVGFGDFVDFQTYESLIREQNDASLDKVDNDFKRAEAETEAGNEKRAGKFRKRIFDDIINGCNSIIAQIDAVQNSISIGMKDSHKRIFQSYKLAPDFTQIGKDVVNLQEIMQSGDLGSSENIETDIKQLKTLKQKFEDLKKKFDDTYNQDLNGFIQKVGQGNPKAYALMKKGDDERSNVENFSVADAQSSDKVVKPTDNQSPGNDVLKIDNPIKSGMKSGVKDPIVAKFQNLVAEKFGNIDGFKNDPTFQKFAGKYKGDGKFGNTTATIIKALKAGFKMDDKTSDITQELVDRINKMDSSKLTESKIFSFDNFSKLSEQFDIKAAKAVLAANTNPAAKKTTSARITGAPKRPDIKSVPNATVQKEIDSKGGNKLSHEDAKREQESYIKLGATKTKDDLSSTEGGMAVAKGKGIRFFLGNVGFRTYDKVLGYVDVVKNEFKGVDHSTDKLDYLINNEVPQKFIDVTKILYNLLDRNIDSAVKDIDQFFRRISKWGDDSIKLLAYQYGLRYKLSLYKQLKPGSNWGKGVYPAYEEFYKKYDDVLSEYDDTLEMEKVDQEEKEKASKNAAVKAKQESEDQTSAY